MPVRKITKLRNLNMKTKNFKKTYFAKKEKKYIYNKNYIKIK